MFCLAFIHEISIVFFLSERMLFKKTVTVFTRLILCFDRKTKQNCSKINPRQHKMSIEHVLLRKYDKKPDSDLVKESYSPFVKEHFCLNR